MALSPVRLRASMSVGSADTIAFTRSNSPALIASMKAALLEVASGIPRFYRAAVIVALLGHRGPRPRADPPPPPPHVPGAATARRLDHRRRARRAAGQRQPLLAARHGGSRRHRRPHRHRRAERRRRRARVGAHGSTWTQTIFRVGDADITSLSGTGAPLLIPGVEAMGSRRDRDRPDADRPQRAGDGGFAGAPRSAPDVVPLDRVPGFAAAVERGPGAGRAAGDHAVELVGAHRPVSRRSRCRLSGSARCCRRRGPVRRGSSEDARP